MLVAVLSSKNKIANHLFTKRELLNNMVHPYKECHAAIKDNKIGLHIHLNVINYYNSPYLPGVFYVPSVVVSTLHTLNPFNLIKMLRGTIIIPLYRYRNRGTAEYSNFSKTAWLISSGARIPAQSPSSEPLQSIITIHCEKSKLQITV